MPSANNKLQSIRSLKIQAKYRRNRFNESTIVPELRISGKWLQNLGFNPDSQAMIIVENDKISIYSEKSYC